MREEGREWRRERMREEGADERRVESGGGSG